MINKLHIYIVSLHSEKVRKQRLTDLLDDAGLLPHSTFMPAIHKDYITKNYLDSQGYKVFDKWVDAKNKNRIYHNPIKTGEIACGIGHYMCWEAFAKSEYEYALILEDDVYWENDLRKEIMEFMEFNQLDKSNIFYLGRIPLRPKKYTGYDNYDEVKDSEEWVTKKYTRPYFSYNLQSYILDKTAVNTILDREPQKNLMTPDEIIPAFYSDHPHPKIKKLFPKSLKALALTRESEPDSEIYNKSVGVTWQQATEGISYSILDSSEYYDE